MKLETREDIAGNVTFNVEKFEVRTSEKFKFNGIQDQKFNEREESKSSYLFMKLEIVENVTYNLEKFEPGTSEESNFRRNDKIARIQENLKEKKAPSPRLCL